MIRGLIAAVAVLVVFSTRALAEPAFGIYDLRCFDDGTLVGQTSDLGLATFENGRWRTLSPDRGVLRLWRSADDRIFALSNNDRWTASEVVRQGRPGARWTFSAAYGWLRFTSLSGVDVVTPDRVYRLEASGRLTDLGETPMGASGQRLPRAPEILTSKGTAVVCTGTWIHHDDSVGGSCQEVKGRYVYLVDFGEPLCCPSDVPSFTAPFICGDAVISARRDESRRPARETTQSRALDTGAVLGRRNGASRQGSACIDGRRALLVGKRDFQIVTVPDLRTLRREVTTADIQAATICGAKVALILEGETLPLMVDLPPARDAKATARTRGSTDGGL